MKKVIIASLLFTLMMGTAVIYAETTSLIGRKVQSEVVVTLDGENIGSVIIIDGVSYAPVRVIAEASGLKAGYAKGAVSLTTISEETSVVSEPVDTEKLKKEKRRQEIEVETLRRYIQDMNDSVIHYNSVIEKTDGEIADNFRITRDEIIANRDRYEGELAEALARIAEIDELLK